MGSFGFMAPEQAWGLPNHIPWPNRSWATANSPPPRKKIDYSLALDPSNADYLLLRDQLLQSGLKFKEARDAFAQILRRQPLNLKRAVEGLEFSQLIPFAICCTNPCCNQEGELRSSWIPYQFRHLQKGMTLNCFF